MKNPLEPKKVPLLVLAGGMLGLLLRLWLFATGVDENGLILQQHPANALVFILTAVVLLALYLCLRPLTGTPAYKLLFKPSVPAAAGGPLCSFCACWVCCFCSLRNFRRRFRCFRIL